MCNTLFSRAHSEPLDLSALNRRITMHNIDRTQPETFSTYEFGPSEFGYETAGYGETGGYGEMAGYGETGAYGETGYGETGYGETGAYGEYGYGETGYGETGYG